MPYATLKCDVAIRTQVLLTESSSSDNFQYFSFKVWAVGRDGSVFLRHGISDVAPTGQLWLQVHGPSSQVPIRLDHCDIFKSDSDILKFTVGHIEVTMYFSEIKLKKFKRYFKKNTTSTNTSTPIVSLNFLTCFLLFSFMQVFNYDSYFN